MRQFGFVGKTRLEAAQRTLPELVNVWREQWCFAVGTGDALLTVSDTQEAADDILLDAVRWLQVDTVAGRLWIGSPWVQSWPQLVFGRHADAVPADPTSDHLLLRAQLALANALLSQLQLDAITEFVEPEAALANVISGPQILLMDRQQGSSLLVLLDASLLNHHLAPSVSQPTLTDRKQAIGSARIKLHIQLPLSDVSVASLSNLQPGDILKTETALSQRFQLIDEDASVLASGCLARLGQNLALQLTEH